MSFALNGHQFQFTYHGKIHYGIVSVEALQDCFQGGPRPIAEVYSENASEISAKAAQILDSGEHRSPLYLTKSDFPERSCD